MNTYVVKFDCPEACIVSRETEAECWEMRDDLGCVPEAVYPARRVILKREPLLSEGVLRCEVDRVLPDNGVIV